MEWITLTETDVGVAEFLCVGGLVVIGHKTPLVKRARVERFLWQSAVGSRSANREQTGPNGSYRPNSGVITLMV